MASVDPLYKHVKQQIATSLREGEWKPGEMLPSEPNLAARYEVGISTIRAALAELAAAGVVVRRQGKGTFVGVHGEQRSVYRFFHVVPDNGAKDLPISEVLDFHKAVADDSDADQLQLPRGKAGRAVFKIRNILRVHGTPVVISDVVIPATAFPRLTTRLLREGGRTLYAVYQRQFGITIIRAVEEIRSARADATARKAFGLGAGAPVLEVRRVAYTFGNRPIEVRRSQVDTRRHHYRIEQGDEI
jgi:GntR family transcriptional regulator